MELTHTSWSSDVFFFGRWRRLFDYYEDTENIEGMARCLIRMERLQAYWPNHKLGDMPSCHNAEDCNLCR